MKKVMYALLAVIAVVACGCRRGGQEDPGVDVKARSPGARFLCVGMEVSARFGACPGCSLDAERMTGLLRDKYGYEGHTLISSQAIKSNVVKYLKEGIESTDENGLFIFCYSGHGGQEDLCGCIGGLSEPEGADSDDEYLCLYDTFLLDDEIWSILSRCRGRVMCVFDCCHSGTMYRSVKGDAVKEYLKTHPGSAVALEAQDAEVKSTGFTFLKNKAIPMGSGTRLLSWSGCKETEYSFGSAAGGQMTNALIGKWNDSMSYEMLWDAVYREVQRVQPDQHPVRTVIGKGFEGAAFK